MCLTTKTLVPTFTVAQLLDIAIQHSSQDIVCYKAFNLMGGTLQTPSRHMKWPSDTRIVKVKNFGVRVKSANTLDINEGLHCYTDKEWAGRQWGTTGVRQMIIPAYTPYIVSADGKEIVALAMRLAKPEKNARPKRKPAKVSKRKLAGKRKKK
jgi:hypothetical protein